MTKEEIGIQEYLNILSKIKGYDVKETVLVIADQVIYNWEEKLEERVSGLSLSTLYDKEVYEKFKNNDSKLFLEVKKFSKKVSEEFPNNFYARAINLVFSQSKVVGSSKMIKEIEQKYKKENLYTINEEFEKYEKLYDKDFNFSMLTNVELESLIICINNKISELKEKLRYNPHGWIIFHDNEENVKNEICSKIEYYSVMLEEVSSCYCSKELGKIEETSKVKSKVSTKK